MGTTRGIYLNNGGSIINEAGGTIIAERGIDGGNDFVPIAVSNFGTITGTTQGIGFQCWQRRQSGGWNDHWRCGRRVLTGLRLCRDGEHGNERRYDHGRLSFGRVYRQQRRCTDAADRLGLELERRRATARTPLSILQGAGTANNDFAGFNSLDVQASGLWALNGSSGVATTRSAAARWWSATLPPRSRADERDDGGNSGGALAGQGLVTGNVTVASGGAIAPGMAGSIEHLERQRQFELRFGSFFQVNANAAGQNDKLSAGGLATLTGGTVQVLAQGSGFAASTPYTSCMPMADSAAPPLPM